MPVVSLPLLESCNMQQVQLTSLNSWENYQILNQRAEQWKIIANDMCNYLQEQKKAPFSYRINCHEQKWMVLYLQCTKALLIRRWLIVYNWLLTQSAIYSLQAPKHMRSCSHSGKYNTISCTTKWVLINWEHHNSHQLLEINHRFRCVIRELDRSENISFYRNKQHRNKEL
jgi:hypothetical protein